MGGLKIHFNLPKVVNNHTMLILFLDVVLLLFCVDITLSYFCLQFSSKFRIARIKKDIKLQKLKSGCIIKNKVFVKKNVDFYQPITYIYSKTHNACLFDTFLFSGNQNLQFKFTVFYDDFCIDLSLSEFYKKSECLFYKHSTNKCSLIITIYPNLQVSVQFANNTKRPIVAGYSFIVYGCNKNIFCKIKGNHIINVNNNSAEIKYSFNLIKARGFSFCVNSVQGNLFSATKFYAHKRVYPQIIYSVLSRIWLTNYSKFKDVANFCNANGINLKRAFYIQLFSHNDYLLCRKILQNYNKLSAFDIQIVCSYKNIYMQSNKNIKFINFYSAKLHIFEYLKKYFSFAVEKPKMQGEGKEQTDIEFCYDYMQNYKYAILQNKNFYIKTASFINYKIIHNSLILENLQQRIVYNFSSSIKFINGLVCLQSSSALVVCNAVIKNVNYLDVAIKISNINKNKKLFINFWQDTEYENAIFVNLDSCIELCPQIALVYNLNTNFIKAFEALNTNTNISNKLVAYYYLIKGQQLGLVDDNFVNKHKRQILQNIFTSFYLAKNAQKADDLIILYLHAKNLCTNALFFEYFDKLNSIKRYLSTKLAPVYAKLSHFDSFDSLINALAPTLFNLELLCDYLLEFREGNFRFKCDKCKFNNVFTLNFEQKHINIWLKGNKLQTIQKGSFLYNQNLFLPYNLNGISSALKLIGGEETL